MITSLCKRAFQFLRPYVRVKQPCTFWDYDSAGRQPPAQPRTKRREVQYLWSRLSRSRVLPPLPLSSVRLIYERLGFPLICAKPRFRDPLSFYPAILSRAFRERPGPSLMAELTKFLGEVDRNQPAATYSLGFVWVYSRIGYTAARSKRCP